MIIELCFVSILLISVLVAISLAFFDVPAMLKFILFSVLVMLLMLLLFIAISPITLSSTTKGATKLPELTVIPISEVYQDTNQTDYVIKLEDGTIQKIVSPKVCIGDANYVIKYDYVNMTEKQAKDLHISQVEYSLVVTSPDVIDTSLTQILK